MELVGFLPRKVFSSLHTSNFQSEDNFTDPLGFADTFHTFTLVWEPAVVHFAVNGIFFAHRTRQEALARMGSWPFDADNYGAFIILNLAVGGDWPGNPDATTQFPQRFLIDYVRVYKCNRRRQPKRKKMVRGLRGQKNNGLSVI